MSQLSILVVDDEKQVCEFLERFLTEVGRRKFLRTTQTEMGHISEAFTRIALAHPAVHFSLRHNERSLYDLPPSDDWRTRIATFFGEELAEVLIWVDSVDDESRVGISGYAANPTHSRSNNRMQYLFLNDEFDELNEGVPTTTYVIDVTDLADPQYVTSFTNGLPATDHNLIVRGHLLFAGDYASGLRVFDVSDVNAVQEIGHFDTYPDSDNPGFAGAWGPYPLLPSGIVLVSDRQRGLFVFEVMGEAVPALSTVGSPMFSPPTLIQTSRRYQPDWVTIGAETARWKMNRRPSSLKCFWRCPQASISTS